MSNWVDVFIGAGSTAGVLGVAAPFVGRQLSHEARRIAGEVVDKALVELGSKLDKHFTRGDSASQQMADDIAELKVQFAKETGGNGNGFRQAIDALTKDVAFMKGALSVQATPMQVNNQAPHTS